MGRDRSRSMSSTSSGRGVQSSSWDGEAGYRIHVSDLAVGITRKEIERTFSKYGTINEVWVATNPPCFAFINYKHRSDAEKAIRDVDGKQVGSTRVGVSWARVRRYGGRNGGGGGGGRGAPYGSYRASGGRGSGGGGRRRSRSRSRSGSRHRRRRYSRSCSHDRHRRRSPSPRDRKRSRRSSGDRNENGERKVEQRKSRTPRSPTHSKSRSPPRKESPREENKRSPLRSPQSDAENAGSPAASGTNDNSVYDQSPVAVGDE